MESITDLAARATTHINEALIEHRAGRRGTAHVTMQLVEQEVANMLSILADLLPRTAVQSTEDMEHAANTTD